MKMPVISLLKWQKQFSTERACAATLAKVRWPQGFQCSVCGSQHYSFVGTRKLYQCTQCRHQDLRIGDVRQPVDRRLVPPVGDDLYRDVRRRTQLLRHQLAGGSAVFLIPGRGRRLCADHLRLQPGRTGGALQRQRRADLPHLVSRLADV